MKPNNLHLAFPLLCLPGMLYAQQKPNVVFIVSDQFRNQALGFNHQDPTHTPNLDSLAQSGVTFSHAISSCPISTPFRAMLITGKYPLTTGVTENCSPGTKGQYLRPDATSFGNVFKANGYQTAYIGKWHLDDPATAMDLLGYSPDNGRGWDTYTPPGEKRQGFEFWHANNVYDMHNHPHYWENSAEMIKSDKWSAEHETDIAIQFISKREQKKPFLMMISYNPPHTPYSQVPERYKAFYSNDTLGLLNRKNVRFEGDGTKARTSVTDYFSCVTGIDDQIGRLIIYLKKEGLYKNTIFVFTSDHGEMMGSQGRMTKGVWYEESINTPLIINYPKKIQRGHSDCIVQPIDFLPTVLGLADLNVPSGYDGKDLSASVRKPAFVAQDFAVMASYGGNPYTDKGKEWMNKGWRGIRTLTHKFVIVRTKGSQMCYLYDLEKDPYELNPLTGSNPEDAQFSTYYQLLRKELIKQNDQFIP